MRTIPLSNSAQQAAYPWRVEGKIRPTSAYVLIGWCKTLEDACQHHRRPGDEPPSKETRGYYCTRIRAN